MKRSTFPTSIPSTAPTKAHRTAFDAAYKAASYDWKPLVKPALITVSGIALAINLTPFFIAQQASMGRVRDLASAQEEAASLAQINSDEADRRLATLCTDFAFTNKPGESFALSNGQVILDRATGYPLADGSIVCDPQRRAGVILNGVVSDVKISHSKEGATLVQNALAFHGLKMGAGDPAMRKAPATIQTDKKP